MGKSKIPNWVISIVLTRVFHFHKYSLSALLNELFIRLLARNISFTLENAIYFGYNVESSDIACWYESDRIFSNQLIKTEYSSDITSKIRKKCNIFERPLPL